MNAQMFLMLIKLTIMMIASFWLVLPWYAQTLQIVGKSPTRERELWGQRPRNHLCDQSADSDQTQSWWLQYGTECRSQNVGYGVSSTVGSTVCSTTLCSTGSVHILSSTGNCRPPETETEHKMSFKQREIFFQHSPRSWIKSNCDKRLYLYYIFWKDNFCYQYHSQTIGAC